MRAAVPGCLCATGLKCFLSGPFQKTCLVPCLRPQGPPRESCLVKAEPGRKEGRAFAGPSACPVKAQL